MMTLLRIAGAVVCALWAASAPAATVCVTNTPAVAVGSVRQAIFDANTNAGADLIVFKIPGDDVHTIAPLSPLPAIIDPVIIDGYTQSGASANTLAVGNNAVLKIEIDGSLAGPYV